MRCKTEQQCGNREVRTQVQKAEVQRWRHALTFSAVDMDWGSILHLHGGCKSGRTVQVLAEWHKARKIENLLHQRVH